MAQSTKLACSKRWSSSPLSERCHFATQDLAALDQGSRFDLVMAVTVLQHILDKENLRSAVRRMVDHMAPGGRMVLLEAAPSQLAQRCDSSIFQARLRSEYLQLFRECGLQVRAIGGVDPAPFKQWLLPYLRRLPLKNSRIHRRLAGSTRECLDPRAFCFHGARRRAVGAQQPSCGNGKDKAGDARGGAWLFS